MALAALALVAGCGDDDDGVALQPSDASEGGDGGGDGGEPETAGVPGGGAGDGEVCSLLSAAEIEPVVGNPVADGEEQSSICSWIGPDLEDVNVTLSVQGLVEDVVTCETMREQSPGAEDVAGMGEGAWFEARGEGNFSNSDLWACTGDDIVYVGLAGNRDAQFLREASESLMQAVLDRL